MQRSYQDASKKLHCLDRRYWWHGENIKLKTAKMPVYEGAENVHLDGVWPDASSLWFSLFVWLDSDFFNVLALHRLFYWVKQKILQFNEKKSFLTQIKQNIFTFLFLLFMQATFEVTAI